ncbi:hypothetical protein [Rhodococcus sp. SGAir0479]|uniref:hypothetical protein n=1 Tax=Rhodococcus sp. SGAir0479 TaxID=2567884 RepID=UPI0010CD1AB0|nr:hypothetical protein [Rhodococcus sp. SGAir0479]QCQ91030.1 hypothetical protein E7742_07100 [Rhodococcus sp. SGAir0479]
MTANPKPACRIAVTALAAAAAVAAGAGVASAQIPGETRVTTVFPVDDHRIQLAVDGPNLSTGTVSGSIQNNTDSNLTCTGLDGGPAGTVTRDTIVARSVDFHARFPYSPLAPLRIGAQGPGVSDSEFGLGSLAGAAGSLAGMLWPDLAALEPITAEYDQARLAGQVGKMATSVTVPARTSQPFTVNLDRPSAGTRTDFGTGVFLTCVLDGQRYVFHGYENGRPADLPEADGNTRFLGS